MSEASVRITKTITSNRLLGSALAALSVLVFSLAFQGSRGIWEPDEGRYTNIAVQMLRTGDYITPAWNDDVTHFAKPPFTYWAIAGGIAVLGRNEWGARLANALAFSFTVLVVYALAKRFTPKRPWLPPLIYATMAFTVAAANIVTTDTLLTLWEAVAVFGFVRWWQDREKRRLWVLCMWAGFGLAFLTKGPPGLLPLLPIVVFVWLVEGRSTVLRLMSLSGLAVFAAAGFGWYVLVAATHPGLMTYFIRDEVIGRVATDSFHRNPEWYKPFTVYLPVLILGTLPWTFPLLRATVLLPHSLLSRSWWRNKLDHDPSAAFLSLWFLLPFIVFCVVRSRLALYILPLFVPLALGTERFIGRRSPFLVHPSLLGLWAILVLGLKWGTSIYPHRKDSRPIARAIARTVDPIPSEVVFVDTRPFWGLGLYLGCEVEAVECSRLNTSSDKETLASELSEMESRTLFVVPKDKLDDLVDVFEHLGRRVRILADSGSFLFAAVSSDLYRKPSPPAAHHTSPAPPVRLGGAPSHSLEPTRDGRSTRAGGEECGKGVDAKGVFTSVHVCGRVW